MGIERVFEGVQNLTGALGNFAVTAFNIDAKNKLYAAQRDIATEMEGFRRRLALDPNFGTPEGLPPLPDWTTWRMERDAAGNMDTAVLRQEYDTLVAERANEGYMGRFTEQIATMQQRVDAIDNPQARDDAQRFLDQTRIQMGAEVYDDQVNRWKQAQIAAASREIEEEVNSGAPPADIMAMVTSHLDDLQSVNAITPAQRDAAIEGAAQKTLEANVRAAATEIMQTQGYEAAQQFVIDYREGTSWNGSDYFLTDQSRAGLQQQLAQTWALQMDSADERLMEQFQAGTLTRGMIFQETLDDDRKFTWLSRIAILEGDVANGGRSFDGETMASVLFSEIERGERPIQWAYDTLRGAVDAGTLTNEELDKGINYLGDRLEERLPQHKETIDRYMALFDAAAMDTLNADNRAEMEANPMYAETRLYVSGALMDLLAESTTRQWTAEEFQDRMQALANTTLANAITLQNTNRYRVTAAQNAQGYSSAEARNQMEYFLQRPDAIYIDNSNGAVVFAPGTQERAEQMANLMRQTITQNYGIALRDEPGISWKQEGAWDVAARPIFTGEDGKIYMLELDPNRNPQLLRQVDDQWLVVPQPTAARPAAGGAAGTATLSPAAAAGITSAREVPVQGGTLTMPVGYAPIQPRGNAQAEWAKLTQAQQEDYYRTHRIAVPPRSKP